MVGRHRAGFLASLLLALPAAGWIVGPANASAAPLLETAVEMPAPGRSQVGSQSGVDRLPVERTVGASGKSSLPVLSAEEPLDGAAGSALQTSADRLADVAVRWTALKQDDVGPVAPQTPATIVIPPPDMLPLMPSRGSLEVRASRLPDDAIAVDYRWERPVAAAAFRRDDKLWLVFAAHATAIEADSFGLASTLQGSVLGADRQRNDDSLVFRLQLRPGLSARFKPQRRQADNLVWRLVLAAKPAEGDATVAPVARSEAERALRPVEGERMISLVDPQSGLPMLVFPSGPTAAAPRAAASFPQVEVLPSLVGLVLRPRASAILPVSADGFVMPGRTRDHPSPGDRVEAAGAGEGPAQLGFAGIGQKLGLAQRRAAEAALASAPHDLAARAGLARTLLGMGLSAEAKAVLQDAGPLEPWLAPLAAAAEALGDPASVAPERFVGLAPKDAAEAALWRAYLHAAHGAAQQAVVALSASNDVLLNYPPVLRQILGRAIVAAQIAAHDTDGAIATLDGLIGHAEGEQDRAAWNLLQAQALAEENALPAARRRLSRAAMEGDGLTKLAARGALLDLDVETGQLDALAANAELGGLRRRWEGSPIALEMERRQLRVAVEAKDWAGAVGAADRLAAMGASVETSRDAAPLLAQALADQKFDLFAKLDLVQHRSKEELRQPALADELAKLAMQLERQGHPQTAQALLAALDVPATSDVPAATERSQASSIAATPPSPAAAAFAATIGGLKVPLSPAELSDVAGALRSIGQPAS